MSIFAGAQRLEKEQSEAPDGVEVSQGVAGHRGYEESALESVRKNEVAESLLGLSARKYYNEPREIPLSG